MIRRIARPASLLVLAGWLAEPCQAQIPPAPPPVGAPPVHAPRGPRLQPNLIPPAPKRPFEWGRSPGHLKRYASNACGVPAEYVARYERQIPVVAATSTTFFPPVLDTITLRSGPTVGSAGIAAGFPVPTPATATAAATLPGGQMPAPGVATVVRRKRFRFIDAQLALPPFSLPTPGVTIYDSGEFRAAVLVTHDGGPAGADRGARVRVRLSAFADGTASGLAPGPALLWSTETVAWVPRGGPTEVALVPEPGLDALVARGFDEVTHLQITIEPLSIR